MILQKFELGVNQKEKWSSSSSAYRGETETMAIDTVIVAIGQGPNPIFTKSAKGLELTKKGNIITNDHAQTSLEDIFAGGDIVTGAPPLSRQWVPASSQRLKIDKYSQEHPKQ